MIRLLFIAATLSWFSWVLVALGPAIWVLGLISSGAVLWAVFDLTENPPKFLGPKPAEPRVVPWPNNVGARRNAPSTLRTSRRVSQ